MEQCALKAVINLIKFSPLADVAELLEHDVIEECKALFSSNGKQKDTEEQAHLETSQCSL